MHGAVSIKQPLESGEITGERDRSSRGFSGLPFSAASGPSAWLPCFCCFPSKVRERLVPFLVSYATGTLLGASLLGLLPEAIEQGGLLPSLGSVLAGLIAFFVLERFLIWRHCHHEGPCEVHGAAGQLILVGDALHNFVDGAVIAAAFMSSVPLGIATGIAVIAHELPQEVGDFAILLDNGFSPRRALTWNLVSGSTTIPGALLAYVGLQQAAAVQRHNSGLVGGKFSVHRTRRSRSWSSPANRG